MMAENTIKREPQVKISYDELSAYVMLPVRGSEDSYTVEEVMNALAKSNVTYGIDSAKVREMVETKNYGKEVLVAQGTPAVNGIDARFELNFNDKLDKKPLIREDGSVDYWSIHAIEVVEEGQVLATYVEPVDGKNGISVKGRELVAKKGRPLPPLTGKGFERSEDNLTYTASISGKIEKNKNRITILPIYEVAGDADLKIGNIDFRGDVVIHGNVCPGESIRCTGSITVDGVSEGCTMKAGKDIILRGGVIGGEKTKITAKGNIIAKFIEFADMEAEGYIEADSAMNSEIISYDKLYFHGNPGAVVGGSVFGCAGVEADCLGNDSEIKTEVGAGIHRKMRERRFRLESNVQEDRDMIKKLENGLKKFDEYSKEKGIDMSEDERRVALLRAKIEKQSQLCSDKEALALLDLIEKRGENATVKVNKSVYPGVDISIDSVSFRHKYKDSHVEFYSIGDNIRMLPIEE